jgi:NADH-quinone oxidoreductase subunit M
MTVPLLTLVTFLPLAGAIVIAFAPTRWARNLALATALLTWAVSLVLAAGFQAGFSGFQFKEEASWIPLFGIEYKLGVDGLSLALVVLTTTLTWISILASFKPIQVRIKEYMVSFLILEVGMTGVFLALDTFLFYIFWEVVLVPMYLIIGIWGGSNRIYATIKFVLYTLVGSLLMLVAILATAFTYQAAHNGSWVGAFDFEVLRQFAGTGGFSDMLQLLAFAAFFLAFAIKVPMFPFHTWLPDAHVEAPTAGSVILAGILLKLGGYGLIRFAVTLYPNAALTYAPLIIVLSLIAIIYGAWVATVQPDLKKLVAYSSVSHLGFVMLGIWGMTLQSVQGALMVMISHGFSTGALFLLIGILYDRRHTRLIADFGGLARVVPVFSLILTVVALSSIGLPGLTGFIGEFLVLLGSFTAFPWATGIATTGVIFAAAYLLWALQRIIYNRLDNRENEHLSDLTLRELAVVLPLVVGIVWLGLYPKPVLDRMEPASRRFLEAAAPGVGPATQASLPVREAALPSESGAAEAGR